MADRVAIVTGAGTGIGKAIAIKLASLGYAVALVGRRAEPLQTLATALTASGHAAIAVPTDVTDAVAVEAMIARVQQAFGRIDAVVNNAGYAKPLTVAQTDPAEWHRVIDTNLSSMYYVSRAAWEALKQSRGVVVSISSMAARDPYPGLGVYGVAKVGINMLTLVLAREGKALGIRAHAIAPAGVETEMFRQLASKEQVPTEQILLPEEVADAVAECVTGSLRVANGETLYLHRGPA